MTQSAQAVLKAAEQVGGAATLAALIGVRPQMVSQWVHGVRPVPAERCPQIERVTLGVVRCEELRGDIEWDVLRQQAA